jgi:hypothetical protein
MIKDLMKKMVGADNCKQMKEEIGKAMREGTPETKQAKISEIMAKFSEHIKEFKPEEGQNWNNCFKDDGNGNSWNSLRAKIQRIPEGVLEACPGTSLIEEIEILNDTFWPWKKGCVLTLHDEQTFTECPIEIINIPIEQDVKGKQVMKISVPLTILPHIQADENTIYTINLTFRGPQGSTFGDIIPIQLKVTLPKAQVDELEIYKLAIKLHELNLGSFEECAKAVKDQNCDEANSIKALQRKD